MVDRESNRSKGFGFVTFEDQPAVDNLVQIHNIELDGKMVRVYSPQVDVIVPEMNMRQ